MSCGRKPRYAVPSTLTPNPKRVDSNSTAAASTTIRPRPKVGRTPSMTSGRFDNAIVSPWAPGCFEQANCNIHALVAAGRASERRKRRSNGQRRRTACARQRNLWNRRELFLKLEELSACYVNRFTRHVAALGKKRVQRARRVRAAARDFLGRPFRDDAAAAVAALG